MEIIYSRVAGIDVGKREVAVAVRIPGDAPGQRRQLISATTSLACSANNAPQRLPDPSQSTPDNTPVGDTPPP